MSALTPTQMLAKYEDEVKRLISTKAGIDMAIFRVRAKIEAVREILGMPIAPKRGRKKKTP